MSSCLPDRISVIINETGKKRKDFVFLDPDNLFSLSLFDACWNFAFCPNFNYVVWADVGYREGEIIVFRLSFATFFVTNFGNHEGLSIFYMIKIGKFI